MTQLLTRPETVILAPQDPPPPPNPRDPTRGAWFGDPELKAAVLDRMIAHRVRDDFYQGIYMGWYPDDHDSRRGQEIIPDSKLPRDGWHNFKGCAVGCTLVDVLTNEEIADLHATEGWHGTADGAWSTTSQLSCAGNRRCLREPGRPTSWPATSRWTSSRAIPVGADLFGVVPSALDMTTTTTAGKCEGCVYVYMRPEAQGASSCSTG